MGGHQELLSGVTPWTRGCFFTKTTLEDVVHYVTGEPTHRGICWMVLILRTLGTAHVLYLGISVNWGPSGMDLHFLADRKPGVR